MAAELHANPNPATAGSDCEICITGAAANSPITIKCRDASGEVGFTIETDGDGKGCYEFTVPSGWTNFTVDGGGAPTIDVLVT